VAGSPTGSCIRPPTRRLVERTCPIWRPAERAGAGAPGLRPGPDRAEGHEPTVVARHVCRPDTPHPLDPLIGHAEEVPRIDAVVRDLLDVPPRTDPEQQPCPQEMIQCRHGLGRHQRSRASTRHAPVPTRRVSAATTAAAAAVKTLSTRAYSRVSSPDPRGCPGVPGIRNAGGRGTTVTGRDDRAGSSRRTPPSGRTAPPHPATSDRSPVVDWSEVVRTTPSISPVSRQSCNRLKYSPPGW